MRGGRGRGGALILSGISFSLGILCAMLLPNALIVILLTFLLLLFCFVSMR